VRQPRHEGGRGPREEPEYIEEMPLEPMTMSQWIEDILTHTDNRKKYEARVRQRVKWREKLTCRKKSPTAHLLKLYLQEAVLIEQIREAAEAASNCYEHPEILTVSAFENRMSEVVVLSRELHTIREKIYNEEHPRKPHRKLTIDGID